jgi:adenylylsulfate kinase
MEKRSRSLVKAASWRIVATITTTTMVYLFTGNLVLSATVGALEQVKIVVYYLHERLWNMVNFGREIPASKPSLGEKDTKNAH